MDPPSIMQTDPANPNKRMSRRAVVTGAFSNIGSAAARALLGRGYAVHSLTNRTRPQGSPVTAAPLRFEYDYLKEQLAGATVVVNTYWIRFPHGGVTFDTAVENNRVLIRSAAAAGVERFVHVSVSNPDRNQNLRYYAGKAQVEEILRTSSLSHAIVRPTLVVGPSDILTNNIAWFLRRFPVFPMPRGGECRLTPITLDDMGRVLAEASEVRENTICDAAGPETCTFREYVGMIAAACGVSRWMPTAPNWLTLAGIRMVEPFLRDVVLTGEELLGLQQEALYSREAPRGTTSVSEWLASHGGIFGVNYANDLRRHFGSDRSAPVRPFF